MIARAYAEDLGEAGDVTSMATIPSDHRSIANIVVRSSGCIAGVPVVEMCLTHIDPSITTIRLANDGAVVEAGAIALTA